MTRLIFMSLLGWGGLLGFTPPIAAAESDGIAAAAAIQEAFVEVIASAEKSVVSVARTRIPIALPESNEGPRRRGPIEPQTQPDHPDFIPNEFGAGIVIDENGLILTNYHLVRGGPAYVPKPEQRADQLIFVRLPDRRGFEARIYAADPRSDLAVLKIAASDLKPIRMGNTTTVRKGQFVIALGNPYHIARDGSASATWGIVSNLVRNVLPEPEISDEERQRRETLHNLGVLIQVDTRLDLGTSGGALLNLQGELIGITTSLASIVGYEKSAGFAVPIDDSTRRIIESLRLGKEVEYGFLGIFPQNVLPSEFSGELAPVAARTGQYGAARIKEVGANLPAHKAGIQPNDLILRVGDKPILSTSDLMREIGLLAPGTITRLRVWRRKRDGEMDIPVEVGKWPAINEDAIITSTRLHEPWRGIVFDYPTARRRSFKALENPRERNSGVLIVEVLPDSPAASLGLQPDDLITQINGRNVHSPRTFEELVQGETGPVQLQVLSGAAAQGPPQTIQIKPR